MVGKVAGVFIVLEHYGKGHRVVGLPLPPIAAGDTVVVAVICDLGTSSDPALLIYPVSCGGEHQRLHTIVELAVWLLAVDDIEAIGHPWLVVGDHEIEPLMMMQGVDVRTKKKVVFIFTNL